MSFSPERPLAVEFIPTANELAMRFASQSTKVKFYTRAGAFTGREIDLALTASAAIAGSYAFFNPSHPSGGQFLFIANSNRFVITDFNGLAVDELNYRDELALVRPTDVAAISSGPYAGSFSVVDREGGEMVVFRLRP